MLHQYDVVIVGAGLAGSQAAVEAAGNASVAVLTKVFPTRSHSSAAQGGIASALGNIEEDSWEWHMFDTVKGSDYLGDQDAIEVMTRDAIATVYELEHMGCPFSRTEKGKIAQRPFGGHTRNFGEAAVKRACYAADRTGHVMLHTLYENCVKKGVKFYTEYHVMKLIIEDGACKGVIAYDLATGELHIFHAKAVIFATGGWGRMYKTTSNAHTLTGDGTYLVFNEGLPLEDMEFFQFHPTGIYRLGILITEGARGEGGILLNKNGERFMEHYAPTIKDLAPRDIVSRCILQEIREGRGIDGKDYVYLDLRHLGKEVVEGKLPDITSFCRIYLGVDPVKEPIPIHPTAHYTMGGIPTDIDGRVIKDPDNIPVPGLYAAGECACVSVHGGNRLGCNSLLDTVTFGRRSGKHIVKNLPGMEFSEIKNDYQKGVAKDLKRLLESNGKESPAVIRAELQELMMSKCSAFRTDEGLAETLKGLKSLQERYKSISITDKGKVFNYDLIEALELGYMLKLAETIAVGAKARQESRGAHCREDFIKRDDVNWLKHTLAYKDGDAIRLEYKKVVITRFQPKERKY